MSAPLLVVRPEPRRPFEIVKRLATGAMILVTAVVLGVQYVMPDKRILALMAATIVFGVAWRVAMISGVGLLLIALPFPRGTVFGNTNFALILLLLVIWLMRASLRLMPRPHGTRVDWAVIGLIGAFIISFYNIERAEYLAPALSNFELVVASVLLFYLLVNSVRDEADLERLHTFQLIGILTVCLLSIFELTHPGSQFIPGWIGFENTRGSDFNTHNIRVGGPFFDYELLSEFCALSLLLVTFRLVRARTPLVRTTLAGLLVLTGFVLFATVTRGAIIALGVGIVYLIWLLRRRLTVVSLTMLSCAVVAGFLAMNAYVAHFTRSGDVLSRLSETHFYGVVPDSRVQAWQAGWTRFLQHPLIGHGPFYSQRTGVILWTWPHNGYLYIANLVGLVGLTFFIGLLVHLWRLSRPRDADLRDESYARAFLVIAHVQLVVFAVDQVKIDYMRNLIYQFQPWILFASIVIAHRVAPRQEAPVRLAKAA